MPMHSFGRFVKVEPAITCRPAPHRYFVGNIYSTLSLTVCGMRGLHRAKHSNMCEIMMHPDVKYLATV